MINDFENLQLFVDEMKATPSSNKKKEILKKWEDNEFIMKVLLYTNDSYRTYGVTSKNTKKYGVFLKYENTGSLFDLLDKLCNREITGNDALLKVNTFVDNNGLHEQLIYNIIDKDLETRANVSLINKVFPNMIPEFKVALANKHEDKLTDFNKDEWYSSRKLDGVRCICKIDEYGNSKFYSRTGNEFFTLNNLKETIKKNIRMSIVLDGEVCIVDEDNKEDFQACVSEVRKKDHTIEHPKFFVFDVLTHEEFDNKVSTRRFTERMESLKFIGILKGFELLRQHKITSGEDFNKQKQWASDNKYEGIMVRKNIGYKGKRCNDLLKVKTFMDDEYTVKGVINDDMRFFENGEDVERETLAAVIITHKGYTVKVGSGFSKEQREYYYNNPNKIIGSVITVQYFEETKNKDGGLSLRFPTFKCIHGKERTT